MMDSERDGTAGASPYEVFVRSVRADVKLRDLVEKNYLDDDLGEASSRYAKSAEFARVLSLLRQYAGTASRVLDLGAGRGLTSLALAEHGLRVTAVEYDPSEVIGAGALARLWQRHAMPLEPLRADALQLPFRDGSFNVAFCRSVLHHLPDLPRGLSEILRILKPGGLFLACGEHIRSPLGGGRRFLASHPAVSFGVDERAYPTLTYRWFLWRAGFRRIRFFGFPLELTEFVAATQQNPLRARLTTPPLLGPALVRLLHAVHVAVRRHLLVPEKFLPAISIVAEKPAARRERPA